MSDANATTPRVYIARHGETEWTINGRCTGKTELELTQNGTKQVRGTGEMLVGPGKLVDPSKIAHIFCSPRRRAVVTMDLLLGDEQKAALEKAGNITITEDIAEWDYGDYEGVKPHEIAELRKRQGLEKWNIWVDGCPNGESAKQVEERLDRLIHKIYEVQEPLIQGSAKGDVLVVAHGHILRAFTKRWLKYPMDFSFTMMMEPGAIGIMSYAHHSIKEPAILVGMGFPQTT